MLWGRLPLPPRMTPLRFWLKPTTTTTSTCGRIGCAAPATAPSAGVAIAMSVSGGRLQCRRYKSQAILRPVTKPGRDPAGKTHQAQGKDQGDHAPPQPAGRRNVEQVHDTASLASPSGFRAWLRLNEVHRRPDEAKAIIFDTKTGTFNRRFSPTSLFASEMITPPKPWDLPFMVKFLSQARAAFVTSRNKRSKNPMGGQRRGTLKLSTAKVVSLLSNPHYAGKGILLPTFHQLVRSDKKAGLVPTMIPEYQTHHLTPLDVFTFAIGHNISDIQVFLETENCPSDDGDDRKRVSVVWVTVNARFADEVLLVPCNPPTNAGVKGQLAPNKKFIEKVLAETWLFLLHAWQDLSEPCKILTRPVGGGETGGKQRLKRIKSMTPREHDRFPVVFAFQESYLWFMFHGGLDAGTLTAQSAGTWLPLGVEALGTTKSQRAIKREEARLEAQDTAQADPGGPKRKSKKGWWGGMAT